MINLLILYISLFLFPFLAYSQMDSLKYNDEHIFGIIARDSIEINGKKECREITWHFLNGQSKYAIQITTTNNIILERHFVRLKKGFGTLSRWKFILDGYFEKYDKNGKVIYAGIYKNGKLVTPDNIYIHKPYTGLRY